MSKRTRTQAQIDAEKKRNIDNPCVAFRCKKELLESLDNEAHHRNQTRNALIISIISDWLSLR